jgi:hypothetical protein
MFLNRCSKRSGLLPFLAVFLAGCGVTSPSPTASVAASSVPSASSGSPHSGGGMEVSFLGSSDGGTARATFDATGRPLVTVSVEVTGAAPYDVVLSADGLPAVDEGGHTLEARNAGGVLPFTAHIPWSPAKGGGEYKLTVTAMDANKNLAVASIHVTVIGVAPSTPMPPAFTRDQAASRVTKRIEDTYNVRIPAPSLQRFDFPTNPTRSRWIGAAYYKGMRYYVQIFDDGHVEWSNGPYSDPTHRSATGAYTYCRPAGTYRVLIVFVDYGNTGVVKTDALAKVPVVVTWLNGLYANFAASQGFSTAPMRIQADAMYVNSPPAAGALLTAQQVRTLAGKDPASYDFVMQIDLDANATYSAKNFPGVMEPGGGFALQACDTGGKFGAINIWSSVTDARSLQGGLTMDFNHELSHMFGMMDDWPFLAGSSGPAGSVADDWIPYVMFGWTDTDRDGVPEILDATPYGTSGPKP